MSFSTSAEVDIVLEDRSVRAARQQLESDLGSIPMGVTDGGTTGGQIGGGGGGRSRRRARREHRWARERTNYAEQAVVYLEEIEDHLDEDGLSGGQNGMRPPNIGGTIGVIVAGIIGGAAGAIGSQLEVPEIPPLEAPDNLPELEAPNIPPLDVPSIPALDVPDDIPSLGLPEDVPSMPVKKPEWSVDVTKPEWGIDVNRPGWKIGVDQPNDIDVNAPDKIPVGLPDFPGSEIGIAGAAGLTGSTVIQMIRQGLSRPTGGGTAGGTGFGFPAPSLLPGIRGQLVEWAENNTLDGVKGDGSRPTVASSSSGPTRYGQKFAEAIIENQNEVRTGDVVVNADVRLDDVQDLRDDILDETESMIDDAIDDLRRQVTRGGR